jgi:diaminopimelate decarboxylase
MDRGDLSAAVRRAAGSPWLDWLGVHAFTATNVTEADVLLGHAAATLRLAGALAGEAGQAVALVDLGGGLGIPYRDDDPSLDLGRLGAGLATLLEDHDRDPRLAATRLLLEPGRWLVGPAGWYLTRIVDTKRVDGRAIAVVDGGIHHLLRPALVGQPHRISAVVPRERGVPQPVAVVGPLCTGLDALDPAACLPPLRPGDLLVVHDVGAYGFTESMPFFLSHPTPPEVLVEDARVRVIRPSFDPARWMDEAAIPAAILGA